MTGNRVHRFVSEVMTFAWWRHRAIEVVIAMAAVYLFTALLDSYRESAREAVPATDWFEVEELFIPNHRVGSNPDMIYDSRPKVEFRGAWVAEIQRRDDLSRGLYFSVCTGNGVNDYSPDTAREGATVKWDWFFGRPCLIEPGLYQVEVSYDLRVPGYPLKHYKTRSNIFKVEPRQH